MPLFPPITLAFGDGEFFDVIVWIAMGGFWLVAQIFAAKKKNAKRQERQEQPSPQPPPPARAERARPTGDKRRKPRKQEAASPVIPAAAYRAEALRLIRQAADDAIVQGVHSNAGEHRALDTATRHTHSILPRLYAMGLHLAPLPTIPMPSVSPRQSDARPLPPPLRTRAEIRATLIAQAFLQPPKG